MIVDLKTHRVAEIKNKNKVQAIIGDLGTEAFVFPHLAAQHLDLSNNGNAFMKKFSNLRELQTILNNTKKKKIQINGVIFTQDKL